MSSTTSISPPHSLILLTGERGSLPESFDGQLFGVAPTVIAIGTFNEADGPTTITLAKAEEYASVGKPDFAGQLQGLNGRIAVRTCLGEILLTAAYAQTTANIAIFVNDDKEPDDILIIYS